MLGLAEALNRRGDESDEIHVTLDSPPLKDIAHPFFRENEPGAHPAPFTQIRASEVEGGLCLASESRHQARASSYVQALEQGGRPPAHDLAPAQPHLQRWAGGLTPAFRGAFALGKENAGR